MKKLTVIIFLLIGFHANADEQKNISAVSIVVPLDIKEYAYNNGTQRTINILPLIIDQQVGENNIVRLSTRVLYMDGTGVSDIHKVELNIVAPFKLSGSKRDFYKGAYVGPVVSMSRTYDLGLTTSLAIDPVFSGKTYKYGVEFGYGWRSRRSEKLFLLLHTNYGKYNTTHDSGEQGSGTSWTFGGAFGYKF